MSLSWKNDVVSLGEHQHISFVLLAILSYWFYFSLECLIVDRFIVAVGEGFLDSDSERADVFVHFLREAKILTHCVRLITVACIFSKANL